MRKPARNIADMLAELVSKIKSTKGMKVDDALEYLSARGIAIGILMLSLINSLPVPGIPGVSTVTGIPIILLGLQLMIGRDEVWLPAGIREKPLRPGKLLRVLERILPYLQRAEKLLKPRWIWLSDVSGRCVIGLAIVVLAVILALPIPFLNFPIGLTITILAVGLITRDGYIIVAGLLSTVAMGFMIMFLSSTISDALRPYFSA